MCQVKKLLTAYPAEPHTFDFIPAAENICFSFEASKRADCTPEDHASTLHSCYLGLRGYCVVFQ